MDCIFKPLFLLGFLLEQRAIRRSFVIPVVRCYQKDGFRYYENGRWTTVAGELMSAHSDVQRVIYRQCPLKWNDKDETLTAAEREKVFQKVAEHLNRSGIKWKFN